MEALAADGPDARKKGSATRVGRCRI